MQPVEKKVIPKIGANQGKTGLVGAKVGILGLAFGILGFERPLGRK